MSGRPGFTPRSNFMPASHGAAQPVAAQSFAPAVAQTSFAPQAATREEDEPQQASQKVILFSDVKMDHIRIKPKTRNPDRQKQCFPIKYIDSKIPGGRNQQELQVSFFLGHPDQTSVNTIISGAKAYQRDPSMPSENPHNLSLGIKFTDPEIVEWIDNFNAALLNQLKESKVTAVDEARPDIPPEQLEAHFKPPFTPTDDGGYVGYFAFTDSSLNAKAIPGRTSRMPRFERQPYGFDAETNEIVLYSDEKKQIHYSEIVPQHDYCMVIFSLGAMRLDAMSQSQKRSPYPFIGSKLYLEKLILLEARELDAAEGVDMDDTAKMLSSRVAVRAEGEEAGRAKRFRQAEE